MSGFNNPRTTEPTATFELRVYTDATKTDVLDRQLIDLELTAAVEPLTPDHAYLAAAPGGTGEVGKPTKANLHIRAAILMPANTVIEIDFPKYTTEAPRSLQKGYFVSAASTACKAVQNVDAGLKCQVTKLGDKEHIRITGALPRGTSAKDLDLIIEIDSIYNPLSLFERDFAASLSATSARDGKLYSIERGTISWKATTPATITAVTVTSSSTTVQEYVDYAVRFRPDVEIEAGAHALIQFPSGAQSAVFTFDNQLNSMQTIGGMFGSRQDNVKFQIEAANLKIETKAGTRRYSQASIATINLGKIKNPAYVGSFGSFTIQVHDKNKELIAQVTSGVSYVTTSGGFVKVKLYPENPLVDALSKLHLEFAPLHAVDKSSKLIVEITDELTMGCPKDFAYNSALLKNPLAIACAKSGGYNVFTIDRAFVNDYTYSASQLLTIVFTDSTLPYSARGISKLRLSTYTGSSQLVDYYESKVEHFIVYPAPFY